MSISETLPKIKFNCIQTALTAEEMRAVDSIAVTKFKLQILQMMEIAAFQMARLLRRALGGLEQKKILVIAGKGNNGGDAISCARYLHNWGALPTIVVPQQQNKLARQQLHLVRQLNIPHRSEFPTLFHWEAVVDGILGYSISRTIKEPYKSWIGNINALQIPVFSYDLPSGIDPDNGQIHGIAVKATHTLTLAYPKRGLFADGAAPYIGKLYLADIGIPPAVYNVVRQIFPRLRYHNLFRKQSLVQIVR